MLKLKVGRKHYDRRSRGISQSLQRWDYADPHLMKESFSIFPHSVIRINTC